MSAYVCDQCESDVEVVTFESGKTYICPICSEVSFNKIHREIRKKRKEPLKVGDKFGQNFI